MTISDYRRAYRALPDDTSDAEVSTAFLACGYAHAPEILANAYLIREQGDGNITSLSHAISTVYYRQRKLRQLGIPAQDVMEYQSMQIAAHKQGSRSYAIPSDMYTTVDAMEAYNDYTTQYAGYMRPHDCYSIHDGMTDSDTLLDREMDGVDAYTVHKDVCKACEAYNRAIDRVHDLAVDNIHHRDDQYYYDRMVAQWTEATDPLYHLMVMDDYHAWRSSIDGKARESLSKLVSYVRSGGKQTKADNRADYARVMRALRGVQATVDMVISYDMMIA